jgi:hypothetical protein
VSICIYLYNNVKEVHILLQFGFEGFINWIETGKWETTSTNILQNMWIFPETLKTWIIGDGYFTDPFDSKLFYMQTDVGYLRFVFYCGVPGLLIFSLLFVYLTISHCKKFPQYKPLFVLLLMLVFVIWVKVSTDIFLIYALFICIPCFQKETDKRLIRI